MQQVVRGLRYSGRTLHTACHSSGCLHSVLLLHGRADRRRAPGGGRASGTGDELLDRLADDGPGGLRAVGRPVRVAIGGGTAVGHAFAQSRGGLPDPLAHAQRPAAGEVATPERRRGVPGGRSAGDRRRLRCAYATGESPTRRRQRERIGRGARDGRRGGGVRLPWLLRRPRVFALYVGIGIFGATLLGLLTNLLL
jgi:hypothetical protein